MSHYRLYFLDRNDHIRHALDIECQDDTEAIELVEGHRDGRTMELWQGARRVARIEGDGSPQAQP